MTTPKPQIDPNASATEVAKTLIASMENMTATSEQLKAQIDGIKSKIDGLEQLDVKRTISEFEALKGTVQTLAGNIRRNSEESLGMVGAADEYARKFSFIRLASQIREKGAPQGVEAEVIEQATARMKAAGITDVGRRGGLFVPDFVFAEVIANVYAQSVFVDLAGGGETLCTIIDGVPALTGSMPKTQGGCVAYWVGEEDALAESQINVGDIKYNLRELGVLSRITNRMREFGAPGFETALRNDMIQAMAAKLDSSIMYGTGTDNSIRGITKHADVRFFSARTKSLVSTDPGSGSNAAAEFNYDVADEMIGAIEDENYQLSARARFVSHPRLFRRMKQIKIQNFDGQTELMQYLAGRPRIPDSALAEVIGPFSKSTRFPTNREPGKSAGWTAPSSSTPKCTDVLFADFQDVVVLRGMGMTVETDDGKGKGFVSGNTLLKMRSYFDLVLRRPETVLVCPDARARD
jgi:HK97 family phage major capsid protein